MITVPILTGIQYCIDPIVTITIPYQVLTSAHIEYDQILTLLITINCIISFDITVHIDSISIDSGYMASRHQYGYR